VLEPDVGDDGVTDDSQGEHEQHQCPAEFQAVGEHGDDHGDYGGDGVGDDAEELGGVGGVAQLEYDGGQEEAEGVEAASGADFG